jgi:tetratricopeptide (TPR) repeat protein
MVFAERDEALSWLFSEADCVLACVEQSAGRGMLRHAADLLIAIKDCADSGVHSLRYERAATTVRDAAGAAGDTLAEARTQSMLTHAHIVAGRFDQADEESQRATRLAETAGDTLASCWSLNQRGIIANCQSRFADGEVFLLRAISAFRADGNRPSEASALSNLSHINLALGRTDRAVELAWEGLEIYESLNHRMRMANGQYALGRALTLAGRIPEGLEQLNKAVALFRETRQPLWEGVSHFRMAEAHLAAGRPARAAGHAEQALALRGIGGEWMRGRMLTVLGRALVALGQRDRARVCWKDALTVFDGMGASDAEEVRALLTPAPAA